MRRRGQAFIVVVIIFAVVVSVFTISISNSLRYQALEETATYQSEQALYLAEMGVNEMIYNINTDTDTSYSDGDTLSGDNTEDNNFIPSPSGIGEYQATYHEPDNSGFGGYAYIEGIGTIGKENEAVTRKVYASLQCVAYKYCMFTEEGDKGNLVENDTTYFTNGVYSDWLFNDKQVEEIPHVDDLNSYVDDPQHYQPPNPPLGEDNTYTPQAGAKVYIQYDTSRTPVLTINFSGTIDCSIITDYPHVVVKVSGNSSWKNITSDNGVQYPLIVHKSANPDISSFTVEFQSDNQTFSMDGFVYTNSKFGVTYQERNSFTINGMLIAGSVGSIAPPDTSTFKINYIYDYFKNPPPHFSIPPNFMGFLISSFREGY